MLYAKEYRKALAQEFPTESNIQISKRLGENWKLLQAHERAQYFDRAREIDLEHKKKYPSKFFLFYLIFISLMYIKCRDKYMFEKRKKVIKPLNVNSFQIKLFYK